MRYERATDLDSWLIDERIARRGFTHAWTSRVASGNGEDLFIELLERHVHPDHSVLDVGCGHGELTMWIASRARRAIGIDADRGYLELASELAAERGVDRAAFLHLPLAEEGTRLPFRDRSLDMVVHRRGPGLRRWKDEAARTLRDRGCVLGLVPTGQAPRPSWNDELPPPLDESFRAFAFDEVSSWIVPNIEPSGFVVEGMWWADVAEWLDSPEQLYGRASLGVQSPPRFAEVRDRLNAIFEAHAGPHGLELRHQRLLWKAVRVW